MEILEGNVNILLNFVFKILKKYYTEKNRNKFQPITTFTINVSKKKIKIENLKGNAKIHPNVFFQLFFIKEKKTTNKHLNKFQQIMVL